MHSLAFANGDRIPALGLGTWQAAPGDVYRAVKTALQLGYRHIDCAFIYGNEAEIGRALAEALADGLVQREELWITSKLWNNSHALGHVRPALQKTLASLQLDYLDLYLIHWPVALKPDVMIPRAAHELISLDVLPLAVTWQGMEALLEAGLCRHIGVSNCSVPKLQGLLQNAQHKPEMNQIELHPYLQQPAMLEFCRAHGILLTAYSPLGSPQRPAGLRSEDEPVLLQDPTVAAIAARRGVSSAQVLLAWALQRRTVVIPKSVHAERLAQNLAAAEVTLADEDMQQLAGLDRQRRYVTGSFWAVPGGPYTLASLWDT